MRTVYSSIIVMLLGLLCRAGYADEVVFENGERLVGSFVRVEGEKLFFQSQTLGKISVDISRVQSLSSGKRMEILLDDGTTLAGKKITRRGGDFTVREEGGEEQIFASGGLAEMCPVPRPKVRWSARIAVGFTSTHGSSSSEDASLDWSFRLRTRRQRFRSSGWYHVSRNQESSGDKITTEENFTVTGIYDYFVTKKLYGYWSERFKKDHIDDLDYRITSAWGAGYQWSETDRFQFSTFAGLGYLQERYTSRVPNPDYTGPGPVSYLQSRYTGRLADAKSEKKWLQEVSRRNDVIVQSGYHLEWKPLQKIEYLSALTYNPSIDDWNDYNLTSESEVRAYITEKLYGTVKFILDYDSTPGEDSASTDTDYIVGIGWKF